MTVFLDSSNTKPGLEPDFAVRIARKIEHNQQLFQIVSPGAPKWGQTTAGHFGRCAPDIAEAMMSLVTRGYSKEDLKICKEFLRTRSELKRLWAK